MAASWCASRSYGEEFGRLELKVDTEKKAPVAWTWKRVPVDSTKIAPAADVAAEGEALGRFGCGARRPAAGGFRAAVQHSRGESVSSSGPCGMRPAPFLHL